MQKMKSAASLVLLIVLVGGAARQALGGEKLNVYAVNYPLTYFAQRIAGDLAAVTFPAPADVAPAFWMPDAETIAAYQAADLILLNGADYAKWTNSVSLPPSRMVDTSRGFKESHIRTAEATTHSHGPGGEHSHGGTAFTTWLDLRLATQQAEAVAQALIRKQPGAKEQVERNLRSLQADLRELDQRISQVTGTNPGRPLLASHPVYQYLERRYGLNLRSVMWEPDEVPSESQWMELKNILSEHPAKWMLWEAAPADETLRRLRALGVESVVVNPCGNRPSTGDFLTVMSENARALERAFQQEPGKP